MIFDLNGFMQMLAGKQGCCDLQFKWIHPDAGRKSKDVEQLSNAFFMGAKVTVEGKVALRFEFACALAKET